MVGAADVRLLDSLVDEEVRLDLKALIWLSRYDMLTGWGRCTTAFLLFKIRGCLDQYRPFFISVDVECQWLPRWRAFIREQRQKRTTYHLDSGYVEMEQAALLMSWKLRAVCPSSRLEYRDVPLQ